MKKKWVLLIVVLLCLQACTTKKQVLYFQDAALDQQKNVELEAPEIQPNDILSVRITALNPEAAIPYNFQSAGPVSSSQSLDLLRLQGYLVSKDFTVILPVLGEVNVKNLTVTKLADKVKGLLVEGGHLSNPEVNVRILNAKVTVIGEVRAPGTYTYTEQNITLPQALGYAGDLTINGNRKNLTIIREVNGERVVHHIDMTKSDWMDSPYYYIKQNDFIYVQPNTAKVKSAGIVGNAGTVLSIVSILLSTVVIITNTK